MKLVRVARRAALGLARTGSSSGNGSGDIFIAFSAANAGAANPKNTLTQVQFVPNDKLDRLFSAIRLATEEAIINALVAAETMIGVDGHKIDAIPHDRVKQILKKYNRLLISGEMNE
ncbi:MAG TPA: P1 family peptidase [Acidobacteriota bacterium]|nr:P1 family peptidase [Acidobacteriota bacterium]